MDTRPEIEVFFDGACPLCRREIGFLRARDKAGRVRFTDIASPSFDAIAVGREQSDLMQRIQARLPDGSWIEGVEVFRRLYSAIGWGWLVALTRIAPIAAILNFAYDRFARNRLRWTGRCDDATCAVTNESKVRVV